MLFETIVTATRFDFTGRLSALFITEARMMSLRRVVDA